MAKIDYFADCKTLEEVKKAYKRLARENHPDFGGDVIKMQEINAAFDEAAKYFEKHGTTFERKQAAAQTPEKFRDIIEKLLHAPHKLEFEIVGSWIWIIRGAQNFYSNREYIKSLGFVFSSKHKKWYLASDAGENLGFKKRGTRLSMEQIKDLYGCSDVFKSEEARQLA